mmetsp:Transcript_27026/g.77660  ORF Transcript_27026/g.77660 Transcript_27026/m.77660 type:complete len:342 (+) Transcript_27026:867-1892(+)
MPPCTASRLLTTRLAHREGAHKKGLVQKGLVFSPHVCLSVMLQVFHPIASSMMYRVLREGRGPKPTRTQRITYHRIAWRDAFDGEIDNEGQRSTVVSELAWWAQEVHIDMRVGEVRRVMVPPQVSRREPIFLEYRLIGIDGIDGATTPDKSSSSWGWLKGRWWLLAAVCVGLLMIGVGFVINGGAREHRSHGEMWQPRQTKAKPKCPEGYHLCHENICCRIEKVKPQTYCPKGYTVSNHFYVKHHMTPATPYCPGCPKTGTEACCPDNKTSPDKDAVCTERENFPVQYKCPGGSQLVGKECLDTKRAVMVKKCPPGYDLDKLGHECSNLVQGPAQLRVKWY